jgi:transposase
LKRTVVEDVDFDDAAEAVVVSVRPNAKARGRCGRCSRRSPRYDNGEGRRRWRALDLGTTKVFLEADAPRVRCRSHGVVVAAVPWARHGAGHTRDFDDLAAWLAVRTSKSAVCQLLRVAWRTVGAIVTRVNADVDAKVDRLDGLRRIGIDEISYKRGHHYLIVVVDHDTGALVWAGPGRNDAALHVFFDQLGPERAAQLTHVSADVGEGGRPFGAELVEEHAQGGVVAARAGPHQRAGVVVHDDDQVVVAAFVGDLVDPDAAQPIEAVHDGVDIGVDPRDDRPDGAPGDPQELAHR